MEFCVAHVIDIQNHLICRVSKYKKWLEVRQTLLPFRGWGLGTRLPYYLQKVSHDVFGLSNHRSLVDHRDGQQYITLFDERIGPKNTDHTISYIRGYIDKVTERQPWIRKVLLFLDNAANTNKNCYLFSWGMELVQQMTLVYTCFCFLVTEHTKFTPDCLFPQVSNSYNHQDVFTVSKLRHL